MKQSQLFFLLFLISCASEPAIFNRFSGEAQGTSYTISFYSGSAENLQPDLDSILKKVDQSLSTYQSSSLISAINNNDANAVADKYFTEVFTRAAEISARTNGAFDVTVAPVVNAWGFGFKKMESVDSALINSLLPFVGYRKVKLVNGKIIKERPEIMLDFNAIAQGYTVDLLARYLESRGISNYLVELGGEVRAAGRKPQKETWKVGIEKPSESESELAILQAIIPLDHKSLATSGNYRRFYIKDGKRFAHIVDPTTGYPATHNLISATVLADDCMSADAYATAFMVMGMENSIRFLKRNKDLSLQVFFIYDDMGEWKTYLSETLQSIVEMEP